MNQEPNSESLSAKIAQLEQLNQQLQLQVAAHQQAEAALRQSNSILSAVIESIPDIIYVKDLQGRYVTLNSATAEWFGTTIEKIVGKDDTQLFSRETAESIVQSDRAVMLTGEPSISEDVVPRQGNLQMLTTTKYPWYDARGNIIGVVGIARDISDRKLAEETLWESETRYRAVVEQATEGIFFVDAQTKRILEANRAFGNFLGYTPTQLVELSLYDVVALDRQTIDCNALRVLKQRTCYMGECPHRRHDGSIAYAEVNVNAIVYGGREVFCVIAHDVTERKQVEEALRQSEAWLQAILDNSTALIYIKDLEGRYLLVNVWFSLHFYPDRQGIKGKTDCDIFPKKIATVIQANDRKVLAAKTPMDWEEILPHEHDGLHTYLSIKFPLYNDRGEPYAICGISTDITERKRAEDALRSSMATNRALLNAIPDLMFRINRTGIFVNFKAAKGDRLHLPAREFLGKHLSEVFPADIAQSTMTCVERVLLTGEIQILECQLIVNNELRDYELRIAVSAEDEVMAIVRDITDRKRAEAEIRLALEKEKELGELKSRFITMTSHEFRTPLATILSSSELLEHYSHKWSEERKINHLQRIQTSVKHMTQLLNDVLLIGKAEAGKLEFKPSLLNLEQFCLELVEEIQLTAADRKINFCYQSTLNLTSMMDEKLLRHIFINLLSNAIKYSPSGSPVDFKLIGENETAILQVEDRGIGIPLTEQEQVFSSFHRASNVGNISGTGLGLAIVKKSVDLHGGKITVESSVGLGTIFTVILPLNI